MNDTPLTNTSGNRMLVKYPCVILSKAGTPQAQERIVNGMESFKEANAWWNLASFEEANACRLQILK